MINVDIWVEKICMENYEDLYVAGLRYLLKTDAEGIAFLPDDIQEVYLRLIRKKEMLVHHPNITGWLVRTLKKMIEDRVEKARKEKVRIAFSMDDETGMQKVQALCFTDNDPLIKIISESQETLKKIETEIGKENLELLQAYYDQQMTPDELAAKLNIAGAALRMRISRLKRRIKDHPGIL